MTIVSKWSLMLASFADIASAIAEMGGSVSGGYATYAQGVRSIYSSAEYTPQNTYPEKSAYLATNICNQILFCAAVKEEIRQAIIDGGVECGADVPLSQYGDKIRQIEVQATYQDLLSKTYEDIAKMQSYNNLLLRRG